MWKNKVNPSKKEKKKKNKNISLQERVSPGQPPKPFDPLQVLFDTEPSNLQPDGNLYELFRYGGDYTDLQRENKMMEIKGTIVKWSLPVYEVRQNDNEYIVTTSVAIGNWLFVKSVVGTEIHLLPRDNSEREYIERLKTGDKISFKGRIKGLSLPRAIEIDPAIIV